MHPLDGPVLPIAPQDANRPALPLKLRDIPAAAARPAVPAEPRPGDPDPPTVVEPHGPAADEELRAIPAPRERFGHYVVLHQIGEGAMGVVLAAYDQHLDRKVALKLLRADIDDSNEGVHHRMRREAQAMARLSHPNVVQVYEAGEVDGHLFLAMEFVQGVTLRAWMTQRPRPWHEVLPVLLQAGRGLAAAHAAGLTHRDFKPKSECLPQTPPLPPSGRILADRGDLRGAMCRVMPRHAAALATVWQRAARCRTLPSARGARRGLGAA